MAPPVRPLEPAMAPPVRARTRLVGHHELPTQEHSVGRLAPPSSARALAPLHLRTVELAPPSPPQEPPRDHILHHYPPLTSLLDAAFSRWHVAAQLRRKSCRQRGSGRALAVVALHTAGTSDIPWPHTLDEGEERKVALPPSSSRVVRAFGSWLRWWHSDRGEGEGATVALVGVRRHGGIFLLIPCGLHHDRFY